jgi:fibronectin-binding autotransporter adhesin
MFLNLSIMKKLFTLVLLLSSVVTSIYAVTYTSVQSGNWNDPATWGTSTVDDVPGAGGPAGTRTGDIVVIATGHTVTVPSTNSGEFPVTMLTSTWSIAGLTIQTGATVQYNRSITFEAAANPFVMQSGSTLNFNTAIGSQQTLLFKGTETFDVASTVVIQLWNTATVAIPTAAPGTAFGNLTINWTALAAEWRQQITATASTNLNIAGKLTFLSLGTGSFSFHDRATTAYTTVGTIGSMDIQNSCYVRARGTFAAAGTGSEVITINGDLSISGTARFSFHDGGTSTTGTGTLKIGGNLTISGSGVLDRAGGFTLLVSSAPGATTGSYVEFNGTGAQTVSIAALSSIGANNYNWRINNTSTGVTGAIYTHTYSWLVIYQGALNTAPVYGNGTGVSYQLIGAAAVNYTAGFELPATLTRVDTRIPGSGTAASTANVIINNNTTLTGDLTNSLAPLAIGSSGSTIQCFTLGTNVVLTLGTSAYPNFTKPTGSNGGFPSKFINIGASGCSLDMYIGSTSTTLGTTNIPISVGLTNADYRAISFAGNLVAANTPSLLRINTNTTGGGTAASGFNTFTSTRRIVFTFTSGLSNILNLSNLTMNTGTNQEGLATYTAADLRIGYTTGSQTGTYAAMPNHTWTGNNNSSAANGVLAYAPSSNFVYPGSPMYLAYGVDIPKTAANGSWGDAATWTPSGVPGTNDRVIIPTAVTVTLDGAGASPYFCSGLGLTGTLTGVSGSNLNVGGNVTINSGGTMNVPAGSEISMGASCGDTKIFTNNGNLNLTGGTLVSNGQFSHSGGAFNMTSGELINDFNSGSAATSASSFTTAVTISGGTASITGGTITINDPNYGGNGGAFNYTLANLSAPNLTLKMGGTIGNSGAICANNGVLSTSSGLGISVSNKLVIGTLTIAGPAATHYTTANNLYVKSAITVPSGSELRIPSGSTLGVVNNLTVASGGILTTNGTLAFEDLNGSFVAVSPASAQTLTANVADLRNFSTGATADLASMKINNTNGVTIAADAPVVMGGAATTALTLTAGPLKIGNTDLTLLSGFTISGGSATAYVATLGTGSLVQTPANNTTVVYPVGSVVGSYDPASIRPTTSATFGVLVKDAITNAIATSNSAGTADPTKAVQREWNITRTGTSGVVTLVMKPDAAALTAQNTPSAAAGVVAHWNGTAYDDPIAATYAAATGWTVTGYAGTFSPFIVLAPGAVLAVDFTAITAQAKGTTNVVNFATATEKDVKEFAIERSINNKTWEVIGTKAAIGGSTAANYSFTDLNPSTLSYYRVRSVETSGKDQISKIVAVKRNGGKLAVIAVSPVPTTDNVNVDFSIGKSTKVNMVITDIIGRVVKTETFTTAEGANTMRVNLSNLTQGTYIMTLNDGETMTTQRIVKQ